MASGYPKGGYPEFRSHDRYTDTWEHKKQVTLPQQVTIQTLFPQFNRWAIGFDPMLDVFRQVAAQSRTAGYPPYNIYRDEDTYVLELAVAGFAKEDITISVKELQLTVQGELEASETEPIHKGIATRDFKQDFVLAEYVVVKGAELKDGLLRITLQQELPEALQPKIISIK